MVVEQMNENRLLRPLFIPEGRRVLELVSMKSSPAMFGIGVRIGAGGLAGADSLRPVIGRAMNAAAASISATPVDRTIEV